MIFRAFPKKISRPISSQSLTRSVNNNACVILSALNVLNNDVENLNKFHRPRRSCEISSLTVINFEQKEKKKKKLNARQQREFEGDKNKMF